MEYHYECEFSLAKTYETPIRYFMRNCLSTEQIQN